MRVDTKRACAEDEPVVLPSYQTWHGGLVDSGIDLSAVHGNSIGPVG